MEGGGFGRNAGPRGNYRGPLPEFGSAARAQGNHGRSSTPSLPRDGRSTSSAPLLPQDGRSSTPSLPRDGRSSTPLPRRDTWNVWKRTARSHDTQMNCQTVSKKNRCSPRSDVMPQTPSHVNINTGRKQVAIFDDAGVEPSGGRNQFQSPTVQPQLGNQHSKRNQIRTGVLPQTSHKKEAAARKRAKNGDHKSLPPRLQGVDNSGAPSPDILAKREEEEEDDEAKARRLARFGAEASQPVVEVVEPPVSNFESSKQQADVDFSESTAIVGLCPDMCPEPERCERQRAGTLDKHERVDGDRNVTTKFLAVKKFNRTADRDPALIRPLPVLVKSMDHLLELLNKPYGDEFLGLYSFLCDRMRAIRMDLRMQHICSQEAISMLEQMIRLHIIAMHELCEYNKGEGFSEGFDAHLNVEQMSKTSLELFEMYEDHKRKGIPVCTEREFRGYYALLKLDKHPGYKVEPAELSLDLAKISAEVRNCPEITFARDVAKAYRLGNYMSFFRLAKKATYLQACLMHAHFSKLRTEALGSLHSSFQRNQGMPLAHLENILAMEGEDIETFVEHHGFVLKCFEDIYFLKNGPFVRQEGDPRKRSPLVAGKRSLKIDLDVRSSPDLHTASIEDVSNLLKVVGPERASPEKPDTEITDSAMLVKVSDQAPLEFQPGSGSQEKNVPVIPEGPIDVPVISEMSMDVQDIPKRPMDMPVIPESPMVVPVIPDSPMVALVIPESPMVAPVIPERPIDAPVIPESPMVMLVIPESPMVMPFIPESSMVVPVIPERPMDVPVIPARPMDVPVIPENPMDVPVIPESPMDVPVIPERPIDMPVILERPIGMPVILERSIDMPVIAERPTDVLVIPERSTDMPVIPERSTDVPVIPEGPIDVLVTAEMPMDVPVTAEMPMDVPVIPERPIDVQRVIEIRSLREKIEKKKVLVHEAMKFLPVGPLLHTSVFTASRKETLNIDRAIRARLRNQEKSWSVLNTSELVSPILAVQNPNARCICWKLLLSLPADPMDTHPIKWVLTKFNLHEKGSSVSISKKWTDPLLSLSFVRAEETGPFEKKSVAGASSILFLLSGDAPLEVHKARLHNLCSHIPANSNLPLLIAIGDHLIGEEETAIVAKLGLADIEQTKLRGISVIYLNQNSENELVSNGFLNDGRLREGVRWLAEHSPPQIEVSLVDTRTILLMYLKLKLEVLGDACEVGPDQCIAAVNESIDWLVRAILGSASANPNFWPCPETDLLEKSSSEKNYAEMTLPKASWSEPQKVRAQTDVLIGCRLPCFGFDCSWLSQGSYYTDKKHIQDLKRGLEEYLCNYLKLYTGSHEAMDEARNLVRRCTSLVLRDSCYFLVPRWTAIFRRIFNMRLIAIPKDSSDVYVSEEIANVEFFNVGWKDLLVSEELPLVPLDEMIERCFIVPHTVAHVSSLAFALKQAFGAYMTLLPLSPHHVSSLVWIASALFSLPRHSVPNSMRLVFKFLCNEDCDS